MKREKVKTVLDWPIPKMVKDVQKFLGLANYYRRFLEEFVKITRLLYELTRKKQKWEWGNKQKKSFKALKKKFTMEPILVVLDLNRKMRMEVDMLDYATREVLSMKCSDGKWRLVAYLSKSLNEMARNHKIHDKEMLVVIRGSENWRYLLEDTREKFEVWTDYKNLEYFIKA